MRLGFLVLLSVLMIAPAKRSAAIELAPGDLLSAAALDLSASSISVLRVDRETGDRVVISGPSGSGPVIGSGPGIVRNSERDIGLTYSGGAIWVSTSAGGKYIRIDPNSGDRTIVSGCPGFGTFPCQVPLIGAGPDVNQTWAVAAVPEDNRVAREEFDALVADVEELADRIEDLEASDEARAAEIQSLRTVSAALQARVAAIEELAGIRNRVAK